MLVEGYVASIGVPNQSSNNHQTKDGYIFLHEYQPLDAQRQVYKKSAAAPNCLAVNGEHVFAAQIDKAVVHVYNREKGNHESTVPFTEQITAITMGCDGAVLVLGTKEGRLFLWEISSGRQITTSQAHIQEVTVLAVDPMSSFLLSASEDSNIHVWSLPDLLSFSNTGPLNPIRTYSMHRTGVTALALGHSASRFNFAISAERNKTCFVWDYRRNLPLRTFLLPSTPLCVALDPADRAAYLGYGDGSIQFIDLLAPPNRGLDAIQNGADASTPIEPLIPPWKAPGNTYGAVLSVALSFDGYSILSGHQSGALLKWDVARGGFAWTVNNSPLPGPATNLLFIRLTGYGETSTDPRRMLIPEVVKPRYAAFDGSDRGVIPGNYALRVHFADNFPWEHGTGRDFQTILCSPYFQTDVLSDGLEELVSWDRSAGGRPTDSNGAYEDYMALDDPPGVSHASVVQEENTALKLKLEKLKHLQQKTFDKLERLADERNALLRREQRRILAQSEVRKYRPDDNPEGDHVYSEGAESD